jgi:parallel beta-helix repeat protein
VYTQVPSLTSVNSYTWCQIGQGWDIDIDGSWQGGSNPNWLSTVITYTEHIDILATGATWDSSLLSNADLQALSTGTAVVGGNFQFAACLNCSLNGLHLDKGYGHTGAVGCNTWTRYLRVTDCTVDLVYHFCYWFDGVWDSVFDNLVATSFISTTASGFNLAPNTDNRRVSERNTVTNCDVRDVHTGIVVQGSNNLIDGNNVELIQGDNTTHYMIVVETPPSTIRGSWECADNTFSNNTGKGNGKGYGLLLKGNASAFGGGVLRVTNTLAQSNTFGDSTHRISAMLRYEAYAQDNDALSNTYYGGVLKSDASGGTATGNVDTTGGNTSS